MSFIIFDLEFNQDISSLQNFDRERSPCPFEIIQIGAVKLDLEFNTVGTFNRYVKPTFYTRINPFVTELTGITTEQLLTEEPFPEIYKAYTMFIAETDSIFCTWGMSDITELLRNIEDHQLSHRFLSKRVINLQPYVSRQFNLSQKNLLRLQHAVELLHIPITYPFHNALQDAFYTAEIFKKVYNSSIRPEVYEPSCRTMRPKHQKRVIDIAKLLQQFEKMYARKITEEEQEMIKLAYKMGRTNQFLKDL
ncbi:3'-5' exonuclease [Desulfosporosinus youngiae]|uniref:DNA polymerase III epsilon subunit-like 3'-5' exonuclease n=1 Tax=Desulfosporosinus youngiae DSM 17734 TaxID=768710 RepID=H5XSQ0_9FIRM|nr:3'-5' exonuclease [Desulfosporosinus youngiae]EHQ87718.1 DNA polymerase III epsilon subunit-like 3'-5' exonuclease [Desulfosporosinus youngiae DSM 17734]